MGLLSNFDPNSNFWIVNKQFLIIEEFKFLYDSDKSKNKDESSKIMWGICLMYDEDSILKRVPESEREEIVKEEYIKIKGFTFLSCTNQIDKFRKLHMTPLQRSISSLESKLTEREKFLMNTPYTIENGKDLDSMLANTQKLHDLRNSLQEQLIKEKEGIGDTKGGRSESATEKKLI